MRHPRVAGNITVKIQSFCKYFSPEEKGEDVMGTVQNPDRIKELDNEEKVNLAINMTDVVNKISEGNKNKKFAHNWKIRGDKIEEAGKRKS